MVLNKKLFWLWALCIFAGSFIDAGAVAEADVSSIGTLVVDDVYEPNDTLAKAYTVPSGTWLSDYKGPGIQADDDWYRINVVTGYERVQVKCTFNNSEGDIDLYLYNASGIKLAESASSLGDIAAVDLRVPLSGDYYVKVCYGNKGNTYDLLWQGLPTFDDKYEENDLLATASIRLLKAKWLSSIDGLGMQRDDDWYRISVTDPDFLRVQVESIFTHSEGDIDIILFDAEGHQLTYEHSDADNEGVDFIVFTTGYYYIKVCCENKGNAYDLCWNTLAASAPVLEYLTITGYPSVDENKSLTYTCTAFYSNGSEIDVTAHAIWTDNSIYASFDGSGVLCAGSVPSDQLITITAAYGGKNVTKAVTIADVPEAPVSLSIIGPDEVSENSSATYACTAFFESSSTCEVTTLAIWSENNAYTSISSAGVLSIGDVSYNQEVRITVIYEGKIASKTVLIRARSAVTYSAWSFYEEIPFDQCEYSDTPADDGIPNLLKYACGLSALQECCSSDLMTIASDSNSSTFSVNYKRSKFALDVMLEAVWAPSLTGPWIPAGITEQYLGQDADNYYYKASIPVGERGFIRLRATLDAGSEF